jgi:hypothetical protein
MWRWIKNNLSNADEFFRSVAICVFPATLVAANAGVALVIYLRRPQMN